MSRATKGFGSGAGMGAVMGAGLGGVLGSVKSYQDAREQGASAGGAIGAGLRGGAVGALKGTAMGTLTGGAAGAAAPALAQRAAKAPILGAASRFGQREVHSLTGVGDAAYVRSIGGGAADARDALVSATKGLRDAPDAAGRAKAMESVRRARTSFQAAQKAEEAGLTSIPGYVKGLLKDPLGTIQTGAKAQWHNSGPLMRAVMFGAPVAGAAHELHKNQRDGEARGKFERAGRAFGGAASGAMAPLALSGDLAAGGLLATGFGRLGRLADNATRRRRPAQSIEQEPGGGSVVPSENIVSDRAAGLAAESMSG